MIDARWWMVVVVMVGYPRLSKIVCVVCVQLRSPACYFSLFISLSRFVRLGTEIESKG